MTENDIQQSSQDKAPPPSRSVNEAVHADAKIRSAHIEQPSMRPSTKRTRDLAQNCSELIRICSELQQPSESENLEILCFGPKKALPCAGSFRKLSIKKEGPSRAPRDGEGAVFVRDSERDTRIKCKSMLYWKSILNNSEHPRNF